MHYLYNKLQYSMNLLVNLHFHEVLMHTFVCFIHYCAHIYLLSINFVHTFVHFKFSTYVHRTYLLWFVFITLLIFYDTN